MKVTLPVGVAPLAPVTVAVMVSEPVEATEVAVDCRATDAAARAVAPRRIPGGDQVIGIDRAESAGLVVALTGGITERARDTVAGARTAGDVDDIVAGGDIVKGAASGLGEGVKARVDVAGAGGGLSAGGHQVLVEQGTIPAKAGVPAEVPPKTES